MKKIKISFLFSFYLTTCMAFGQSYSYGEFPAPPLNIADYPAATETYYFTRINNVFKTNSIKANDIVFLGNSITENGGDWGSRFSSSIVKNRGISGDQTEGVIKRLGEICYNKPSKVFLLIGVNDLWRGRTAEGTSQFILNIVDTINSYSPLTKVYVQTILPTQNTGIISKIKQVNDLLKAKAANVTNFTLIDIHPLFADANDMMRPEYTVDGTHLNEAGYSVWVNQVKSLIPPTGEVFPTSFTLIVNTPANTPTCDIRICGGSYGWANDDAAWLGFPRLKYVSKNNDGTKTFILNDLPLSFSSVGSFKLRWLHDEWWKGLAANYEPSGIPGVGAGNYSQTATVTQWVNTPKTLDVNVKVPLSVNKCYFLGPWGTQINAAREMVLVETTAEYRVFQLTMGRFDGANGWGYYTEFDFSGKFLSGLDLNYATGTSYSYKGSIETSVTFDATTNFLNIPSAINSTKDNSYKLKVDKNQLSINGAKEIAIYNLQETLYRLILYSTVIQSNS